MTVTRKALYLAPALSLALAACGGEPEAVAPSDDMELAEDVSSEGTVTDQMNSGQPEIAPGGGMAPGEAESPNEPVIPEDANPPDVDPAEVSTNAGE